MLHTYEIIVETKKEVLDPEGRAVSEALNRVGYEELKSVRVSKRYVLQLEADNSRKARKLADKLAIEHFVNPVAETYVLKKIKKKKLGKNN